MKALLRAGVVFALCSGVSGCAAPGGSPATTAATNVVSAHSARAAVTIGKSTKADVVAALGKTTVMNFDSGFEVWVYHLSGESVTEEGAAGEGAAGRSEKGTPDKAEFVLLFAPSGVVTKTRIRLPPTPGEVKAR